MTRFWLAVDDKPILGPFESQDLAVKVRVYVEKARGCEDVWILTDEDLARVAARAFRMTDKARQETIAGYERVAAKQPETADDRERRLALEQVLRFALDELKDGRDPARVAQALRNALVTA